jgi:hypothetical protein
VTAVDSKRFAELLYALAETFAEQVSEIRAELYFKALSDLPIDSVERAFELAFKGCTFFPKPAELRAFIQAPVDDEADLAWAAFQREVTRVGYMRTPSLPETTMATLRQVFGSWRAACSALPSPDSDRAPELMGWRKQFVAAYSDTKRREAAGALTEGEAKNALADISAWRQKQLQGETA